MKRILIPLSIILMLSQSNLYATSYYLYYDSGCMSRMEFAYPETRTGQEYVMYSIALGNTEKLILEVGIESLGGVWRTLPGSPIYCNSPERPTINAAMANAVNQKVHQVFVVLPVGAGQYRVTQVKKASVFRNDVNQLQVDSEQYRFSYAKGSSTSSGDLSGNHSRGRVFYSKTVPYGTCSAYVFRRAGLTSSNYLDIYVVPEFGVVEERTGNGTIFKLKNVNASDAAYALNALCGTEFTARGDRVPSSYEPTLSTYDQVGPDTRRTHTVQPKESLYALAKRYQVNIADLMTWNNLQESSIIQPGMSLYIEGPLGPITYNVNDVNLRAKGEMKEKDYAWLEAQDLYTVQQGETVASIATKLGYTEARFRYFNNLAENRVLAPGEKVKTSDCVQVGSAGQLIQGKLSPYYQDPWAGEGNKTMTEQPATMTPKGEGTPLQPSVYENSKMPYGPVPGKYSEEVQTTGTPTSYENNMQNIRVEQPSRVGKSTTPVQFEWNNPSTAPKSPAVKKKHIVREGESLSTIARKYGMTEAQLRVLNNMGPGETVVEFQTIFVN
jgi:LysM repeat protein